MQENLWICLLQLRATEAIIRVISKIVPLPGVARAREKATST
ncbi:hypothetical protein CA54_01230 [Symmachiella macrocystis]|uniref:Uncharacterized protein n=1 Tax=Symmachiella macrocystis TaxID=2527985 RepID=A0A5C6BHY7_9PLAN|nr:hypothetical protein CA54_01230 [Symmachiella macrocystis]